MKTSEGVVGIMLAGGQARRMGGGDKCLRSLGGQTILSRIITVVAPQVEILALNANGNPERFASFGLPVVSDTIDGNAGPLAGILAGMEWAARKRPNSPWVATVPTDAPFLPPDLVSRMRLAVAEEGSDLASVASGGRTNPVCGLWPVRLRDALRKAMTEEAIRKVDVWTSRYELSVIEYSTDPFDPFFNTNRPEDLVRAESLLSQD